MNDKMMRAINHAAKSQGWNQQFIKQLKKDISGMPCDVRGAMRTLLNSPNLKETLERLRSELGVAAEPEVKL